MNTTSLRTADYFDAMYVDNPDPWRFKSLWYEKRKRALTLACLPAQHYVSGFEPGCANGELSAELATRCDRLLCSDGSALAVQAARTHLRDTRNTEVRQLWLPEEWPDAITKEVTKKVTKEERNKDPNEEPKAEPKEAPNNAFDLIVISEVAYYLSAAQLDDLMRCMMASLTPNGTVVACHWRHQIEGCALRGDEVHAALAQGLTLAHLSSHVEPDFRLDVWSRDVRSVAQREGLA